MRKTFGPAILVKAMVYGLLATASVQPANAQPNTAAMPVQEVNGWNVVRATHDSGIFQRTSPDQWTEFHDSGATFTFEERNRDEWSVYMYDGSRNVWLQIDIHRNMISAGTGDAERIDIYAITGSAAGAVTGNPLVDSGITGRNVIRADYDGGLFQSTNGMEWLEVTDDGRTFRFQERNRDDWSAYLYDASRDVRLQIDIHRQMITIADGNGPMRDLYAISSARR